ncbi:hypothetical protein RP20_CCG014585 [Aedes albopictus]|nr:hypothetical protein RP20_CCG014585 [Aedes albopictus]
MGPPCSDKVTQHPLLKANDRFQYGQAGDQKLIPPGYQTPGRLIRRRVDCTSRCVSANGEPGFAATTTVPKPGSGYPYTAPSLPRRHADNQSSPSSIQVSQVASDAVPQQLSSLCQVNTWHATTTEMMVVNCRRRCRADVFYRDARPNCDAMVPTIYQLVTVMRAVAPK